MQTVVLRAHEKIKLGLFVTLQSRVFSCVLLYNDQVDLHKEKRLRLFGPNCISRASSASRTGRSLLLCLQRRLAFFQFVCAHSWRSVLASVGNERIGRAICFPHVAWPHRRELAAGLPDWVAFLQRHRFGCLQPDASGKVCRGLLPTGDCHVAPRTKTVRGPGRPESKRGKARSTGVSIDLHEKGRRRVGRDTFEILQGSRCCNFHP
jgi:hypothetical protein